MQGAASAEDACGLRAIVCRMPLGCPAWLIALAVQTPEGQPALGPACAVRILNEAPIGRTHVVVTTLPFARGEIRLPAAGPKAVPRVVRVSCAMAGTATEVPAVISSSWPDGTIAWLHAHVKTDVPARGSARAVLRPILDAEGRALPCDPPATASPIPADLPIWTEVEDPWGRIAVARLRGDPEAGPGGVLSDSGLIRDRRFCARHRLEDGSPFLGLRAYLRTFAGERLAELTLLLDDESLGLGPVRFRSFRLVVADDRLRTLPLFATENRLSKPVPREGGGYVQPLLGPSSSLYLGDGTAKAFRFHLYLDDPSVTDGERDAAAWAPIRMVAVPELERVRATGAFGPHGGPAPLATGEPDFSARALLQWTNNPDFGPFSCFGDPGSPSGVARCGDSALHEIVRHPSFALFRPAEGMILQHTLRPTPGRKPGQPRETEAYRSGIPAASMAVPHGIPPPDYEHFSALLLHDWYWLTGDPLARDELARLGRGLRALLSALPFTTSRGEGCCLQSGALIARATGDRELLGLLVRRAREKILPTLAGGSARVCVAQPPLPAALGDEPFDAPWQMALLVRGLHALYLASGEEDLARGVVDAAHVIAGPGWVEGEGPKVFVSAVDPGRYTMPADRETAEGMSRIILGALVLAREIAREQKDSRLGLLERRISSLEEALRRDRASPQEIAARRSNPWMQVALDRAKAGGTGQ
ncbi:MAG: hypothetical protein Fur0037_23070 [Planctomycetota bacterium]